MPRNHRVNFDSLLSKKCSDDPAQRLRTPGCSVREKEFVPHSRTGTVTKMPDAKFNSQVNSQVTPETFDSQVKPEPFDSQVKSDTSVTNGTTLSMTDEPDEPDEPDESNEPDEPGTLLEHAKFNYIDEDTRIMENNYIKKFKEHHETTPQDILAAEMSQSSYIKDPDILNDYIQRVSSISEQGYILHPDPKTRNEYMKTYLNEKTGELAVSYRGTQTWVGQDGRANLANTLKLTKLRQTFKDQFDVDLRTKKAKILQETNEYIEASYGEKVKITTGHSQGSHDSTQAKRNFFKNAQSIVFEPAPGGEVKTHEGKMFTTPNDIVSQQGKIKAKFNSDYQMIVTQSTDKSWLNRATGGHMLDNQAAAVPEYVGQNITENVNVSENENLKFSSLKNVGRGAVTGMLPGIAAAAIVEHFAPDQNEHLKNLEEAGITAGGTSVLTTMVGAGSAPMAETVLPLYASYEAASATSKLTDYIMKDDTSTPEIVKGAISGAYAGAAGGASFVGAAAAQSAAYSAVSSALAGSGTVVAEAAGIELTGLAAAEAGLLTATEITGTLAASEGGLNPILDAAFIATALATGVSGLIGLISTAVHQQEIEKRKKEAAERKDAEEWRQVINKGKMREARFIAKRDSEIKLEKHRQETGYYDPKNKFKNQSTYIQSVKEDTENETDTETENDTENLQAA